MSVDLILRLGKVGEQGKGEEEEEEEAIGKGSLYCHAAMPEAPNRMGAIFLVRLLSVCIVRRMKCLIGE